ncbi:hypothetical protein BCR42DRAFT_400515 [Absidia repens]|uniref:Karyogamy protein n=1 Tax=Absidia repens TaxID=90262 RepID=A0A1X2J1A4_9FUNG|nr:hypothetical protein BCR42DRAFT_400515 [Absidia repens]
MNKILFYITYFLSIFVPLAYSYEFSVEGLKTSLQDFSAKIPFNATYETVLEYRDYLRHKVDEVNLNELQTTGGKRLPTLCSNDDYYYYFIRFIPSPLKSFVFNEVDDQKPFHLRHTSEERHEEFYHTIKALPPAIHDRAVTAKNELGHYVSQVPSSGIHSINDQYSNIWNAYIDEMKDHFGKIKKDMDGAFNDHQQKLLEYIDQGLVVMELFDSVSNENKHLIYHDIYEQWVADKQRLEDILKQQQRSYNQWQNKIESGFLDSATTLGPLRQLAEDMYDNAMNGTIDLLDALMMKNRNKLADWSSLSRTSFQQLESIILSLPTTTTVDQLDEAKKDTSSILVRLDSVLNEMKSDGGAKTLVSAIDSIWYRARNELIYSRWQWKYWMDLWNEKGVYSIISFFTFLPQ